MRWNSFSRSLVFAAVAAAGYVVFALAVSPHSVWTGTALALWAALIVPVYLAGLGPSLRAGMGAGLVAGLLGGGALLLFGGTWGALAAPAASLALCRSGLLYRARFGRALVLEVALLAGSLALAQHLQAPGIPAGALAVWGFFLVQSCFFPIGGVALRPEESGADPFDAARAAALALLEGDA